MKIKYSLLGISIFMASCGGGGSSVPPVVSPAKPTTSSLANAKGLMIGKGSGLALSSVSRSSTSLSLADTAQTVLYQVAENGEVKPVQFKDVDGNDIPTTTHEIKRAGRKQLIVRVDQPDANDKTLLLNLEDGSVIDASAYDVNYAQVFGTNAFMYQKNDTQHLYKVDLANGLAATLINSDSSTIDAAANFQSVFKVSDSTVQPISNDLAFLMDELGGIITNIDGSNQRSYLADGSISGPLAVGLDNGLVTSSNTFGLCNSFDGNCIRHNFYNKDGKLYSFTYNRYPNGYPSGGAAFDGAYLTTYQADLSGVNPTSQLIDSNAVSSHSAVAVQVQYSAFDTDRYVLFHDGSYHITEDTNGVVSAQWTAQNFAADANAYCSSPGSCILFPEFASGLDGNGILSGSYVYWRSFDGTTGLGTDKIIRVKLDGSTASEVLVQDADLQSFQVVGETVVYVTSNGTFSVALPSDTPAPVGDGDVAPEQPIDLSNSN